MKLTKLTWFGLMLAFPLLGHSEVSSLPTAPLPATSPTNNAVVVSTNLPPDLAEVVKLSSAGVGDPVVLAYVKNSRSPYNLSANNILQLKNQGVSPEVVAAILNHDAALYGNDKSA